MLNSIKYLCLCVIFLNITFSNSQKHENQINITSISHATFVLEYENQVIYVDPVGGKDAFIGQKKPSLIIITDIHGDHFDNTTLLELESEGIKKVMPKAVFDKLDSTLNKNIIILNNSESHKLNSKISIEAIPMYNLREEALKFHPKGRGNGYILTLGEKRVYISGDTEDIVEMRSLQNIDIAFVCINLPYTMTVKSATEAVLEFKPKQVYPYHYRGKNGFSDVSLFKTIIEESNKSIEVIQLDWYK